MLITCNYSSVRKVKVISTFIVYAWHVDINKISDMESSLFVISEVLSNYFTGICCMPVRD